MKNDVWDVVPISKGKFVVTSKWIYKIKHAPDGSIEKYKTRFVAHGFSKKEGIDYEENFAPVSRYASITVITCSGCSDETEDTPYGFQERILEWCSGRESVCGAATQIWDTWHVDSCVQIEEIFVRIKGGTQDMVR